MPATSIQPVLAAALPRAACAPSTGRGDRDRLFANAPRGSSAAPPDLPGRRAQSGGDAGDGRGRARARPRPGLVPRVLAHRPTAACSRFRPGIGGAPGAPTGAGGARSSSTAPSPPCRGPAGCRSRTQSRFSFGPTIAPAGLVQSRRTPNPAAIAAALRDAVAALAPDQPRTKLTKTSADRHPPVIARFIDCHAGMHSAGCATLWRVRTWVRTTIPMGKTRPMRKATTAFTRCGRPWPTAATAMAPNPF